MYVSTLKSIVCEWHQFQGLNVVISQSISPKISRLRRARGGSLINDFDYPFARSQISRTRPGSGTRRPPSARDQWCRPIATAATDPLATCACAYLPKVTEIADN